MCWAHLAPYPSMSPPTQLRVVGWTVTCVRPARERPIATRQCALWARDPRATTCVSWRGTRTGPCARDALLDCLESSLWRGSMHAEFRAESRRSGSWRSPASAKSANWKSAPKISPELTRKTNNQQIRGLDAPLTTARTRHRVGFTPQRHSPRRLYLTSRRGYTRSTRPYAPDRAPPPTPRGFFGSKQQDVHQE